MLRRLIFKYLIIGVFIIIDLYQYKYLARLSQESAPSLAYSDTPLHNNVKIKDSFSEIEQRIFLQKQPPVPPIPTQEWGKAKQISEHTYSMNVAQDDRMTTAQELFDALNTYRDHYHVGKLSWDDKLVNFANQRVGEYLKLGKTDEHAGFEAYLSDENHFKDLGFGALGENSSSGYKLIGIHMIEWIYGSDKAHNDNQLNSQWSHVGIAISGTFTELVFGGKKL